MVRGWSGWLVGLGSRGLVGLFFLSLFLFKRLVANSVSLLWRRRFEKRGGQHRVGDGRTGGRADGQMGGRAKGREGKGGGRKCGMWVSEGFM